jgi:hypothetical protein
MTMTTPLRLIIRHEIHRFLIEDLTFKKTSLILYHFIQTKLYLKSPGNQDEKYPLEISRFLLFIPPDYSAS